MIELFSIPKGTAPILIVGFNFGLGTIYYASRDVVLADGYNLRGLITAGPELSQQKRQDNYGACSSCSFTLADPSGELKLMMDNNRFEKTSCGVYIGYPEFGIEDIQPLLIGRIISPISWSEGTREFSFGVESVVEADEIGFAPTKDDFPDLADTAQGVPWPLVFGKCAHVPSVKIKNTAEAYLKLPIRLHSKVFKKVTRQNSGVNMTAFLPCNDDMYVVTEPTKEKNVIYIRNHNEFPQGQIIKIIIEGCVFKGKFDGDRFLVKESNLPKYTNIKVGNRSLATKEEKLNEFLLWLEVGDTTTLTNHHCYIQTSGEHLWYNYCIQQTGTKCKFKYPFVSPIEGHKTIKDMGTDKIIQEVYEVDFTGLRKQASFHLTEMCYRFQYFSTKNPSEPLMAIVSNESNFWSAPADTPVRIWGTDPEIHVFSAVPCSSISGVYMFKKEGIGDGKSIRVLTPIPKEWYTVQLSSNYAVNGARASALIFDKSIKDRDSSQEFEDTVYVTCTSTVGPSPVDILKYILENYTNFRIDSTFDSVRGELNYGANFAIFETKNALTFALEIAWQCRCMLRSTSNVFSLINMAKSPASLATIAEDDTDEKSLRVFSTDTNDIKTKLIGSWTETYKDIQRLTKYNETESSRISRIVKALQNEGGRQSDATQLYIRKENIDKYGVITDERRIYIYNEFEAVKETIDFWGHRFANSWKLVEFRGYMPLVPIPAFTGITFNYSDQSLTGTVKGLVEGYNFDYKNKTITLRVWLPVQAGTTYEDTLAWPVL